MQQPGQQPLRPIPVQGSSELQQLLELVRLSGMHAGRSAFNSVPGGQSPGYLPDFQLYNAAQLTSLLQNAHGQPQNEQLAQLQQWQALQNAQQGNQQGPALSGSAQPALPESSTSRSSLQKGVQPRADKSSNAYATRHQAAEQRRRTRINDRLEGLRAVVPHSERANTATFLEEVIKYVEALKERITALEQAQNLPLTCAPTNKEVPTATIACPTCSLTRMGAPCEHTALARPYSSNGVPFSAGTSQATTFQASLPPSSVLSSEELPSNLVAPRGQKETPDTPPQSLNKEESTEGNAAQASLPSMAEGDATAEDMEAAAGAKRAKIEAEPSTAD